MTVKEFDRLGKRDFENGAVRDAMRRELQKVELATRTFNLLAQHFDAFAVALSTPLTSNER